MALACFASDFPFGVVRSRWSFARTARVVWGIISAEDSLVADEDVEYWILDGDTFCRSWWETDDGGETFSVAVERLSPCDTDWTRADILFADLLRDGVPVSKRKFKRLLAERDSLV
jgi:hypothetical protein